MELWEILGISQWLEIVVAWKGFLIGYREDIYRRVYIENFRKFMDHIYISISAPIP